MKLFGSIVLALTLAIPGLAKAESRYSVRTIGDVVQLRDARTDTVVSVLTPVSNAYEMVVRGHNVIRMAIKSVDEMRARPGLNGVPLLAPFANRLDQTAFYANGKKYSFDMDLGNVRGPIPIHGYLSGASTWKVVAAKADGEGAWVTSRLEFYRVPAYMKQFPFAHTLTMTYRLHGGALEVNTRIDNLSAEPMPVSIGFHPYFQLTDSVRDSWTLDVGARTHWLLAQTKLPTGETEPSDTFFGGDRHAVPMSRFATKEVDDVFSDLERDAEGRAKVSVHGVKQTLTLVLGPKFKSVLVYSTVPGAVSGAGGPQARGSRLPPVSVGPPVPLNAVPETPPDDRGFVAIEPMVAVTNAMNLAQKGLYKELQSIEPGGFWQESFWIEPSNY